MAVFEKTTAEGLGDNAQSEDSESLSNELTRFEDWTITNSITV